MRPDDRRVAIMDVSIDGAVADHRLRRPRHQPGHLPDRRTRPTRPRRRRPPASIAYVAGRRGLRRGRDPDRIDGRRPGRAGRQPAAGRRCPARRSSSTDRWRVARRGAWPTWCCRPRAPGCGAERVPLRYGACADCAAALEALRRSRPRRCRRRRGCRRASPSGRTAGALRGALLAYKEKGRHRLARPLGALLAERGRRGRAGAGRRPVLLVPVPSTAGGGPRTPRRPHGATGHTRACGGCARPAGTADVTQPLRALPRPDSASLDAAGRAARG